MEKGHFGILSFWHFVILEAFLGICQVGSFPPSRYTVFSKFASRGLERSMRSLFEKEKDMNIVNIGMHQRCIYVKANLLEVVFAVDLLIHLTSNQVCPNPSEPEKFADADTAYEKCRPWNEKKGNCDDEVSNNLDR